MGFKIFDRNYNEVSGMQYHKKPNEYGYRFLFDTPEEALLHLIVFRGVFTLENETIRDIEEISKPVIFNGVNIDTHFMWNKFIFHKLGNIYGYVGEMDKTIPPVSKVVKLEPEVETPTTDEDIIVSIYFLESKLTPNTFYIGQSKMPKTRIVSHYRHVENGRTLKDKWINSIIEDNGDIVMHIIENINLSQTTYENVLLTEARWIKQFMHNEKYTIVNAPISRKNEELLADLSPDDYVDVDSLKENLVIETLTL